MAGLTCGLDIGTTNIKVVLTDAAGRVLARQARPTPRTPSGEGDAPALVDALEAMILAAWRSLGTEETIDAIAAAGVGEDGLLVDRALKPLGAAIPWYDLRATAEAEELAEAHDCIGRTGIEFEPTRTAAKWLWLSRHQPDAVASAHAWIALTDYPAAIWSKRAFMSRSLAARTACYDITESDWIPSLLDATGAPPLPLVLATGSTIGTMAEGPLTRAGAATIATRLVAGGHDHPVAASVALRADPDAIVDSLGTAELIYAEADGPVTPRPGIVRSVPIVGKGAALLKVFELTATLAPIRSQLDTLLALPAIPGSPDSAAVILPGSLDGKDLAARLDAAVDTEKLVLARRVLEGCAVVAARILDDILASGAKDGPLFTTGGWSRSDALLQLRADIFGRPLHRLGEPELAALGAALIATRSSRGTNFDLAIETITPKPDIAKAYVALRA